VKSLRLIKLFFFFQFLFCPVFSGTASQREISSGTEPPGGKHFGFFPTEYNKPGDSIRDDSFHRLNFRYPDGKKGLKPWITPALLISGGTALHFMTDTKESVRGFLQENLAYDGRSDDYIQYAPLVTVYALNLCGIKGKNNFGNRTALALKSFLLNDLISWQLKHRINEKRPSGGGHSFPSGHTSRAFAFAHFMHKEYGEVSPWFSIGAYSCAATVGYMRLAKDAHWISDVVMGAGLGILSTELIYLTHQYKWDNEHLKRFDIFPFRLGNQKGITLVYNF
jgi:membrane-associated phospholipid phosphatase